MKAEAAGKETLQEATVGQEQGKRQLIEELRGSFEKDPFVSTDSK